MTLTQLHYVITIAETKSFNKAAEKLYVSQPSLTSAIKELEKELGISIFYRNGRGAVLTNDGTEFLLYAKQIYGQYESVLEKYGKGGSYRKKFGVSSIILLQSSPLWIWQENLICPNTNLPSAKPEPVKLSAMSIP